MIHQRHRRTDGQTDDMRSQDRTLHYSASRGKNCACTEVPMRWCRCRMVQCVCVCVVVCLAASVKTRRRQTSMTIWTSHTRPGAAAAWVVRVKVVRAPWIGRVWRVVAAVRHAVRAVHAFSSPCSAASASASRSAFAVTWASPSCR